MDLMATTAAIVGKKLPAKAGEDSFNILPVLLGEKLTAPVREATVLHSYDGSFAIRQGPWRLATGLGSRGFTQPPIIRPRPGQARASYITSKRIPKRKTTAGFKSPTSCAG